jgi:hypothetical protein
MRWRTKNADCPLPGALGASSAGGGGAGAAAAAGSGAATLALLANSGPSSDGSSAPTMAAWEGGCRGS